MRRLYGWIAVGLVSGLCSTAIVAAPLGTGFAYQGQLKDGGAPLDGTADFQFSLWDAAGSGNPPTGGTQIGAGQAIDAQSVTTGLFTVTLNGGGEFGVNAFNGSARWLQIAVRSPAGGGGFTTLAPRQPLTAAPHTLFALNAASATNATLLDNLDSTAFLQSIPVPLTLSGSAAHIIRAENSSTGLLPLAVYGRCTAATVGSTGVRGESASTSGRGVYGYASALSGNTFGVMGDVNSPTGYAGYFAGGRNYFEGNVGIGTASPGQLLDINGRIRARQGADTSAGMWFYQEALADDRAFVGMRDDDSVGFYGADGGGWGLTMDVASGNVGFGTNTPAAKIHVQGGSDSAPGGGGFLVTGSTTSTNISIDDDEIMARNNGATSTLFINNNGGDVVFGGAIDIGYQIVFDESSTVFGNVSCPAGKLVLGGGGVCPAGALLIDSRPYPDGTGWHCLCSFVPVTAYAICANVK